MGLGQTGDDRALAASLQYALQELSGSSNYQPIMELAGMPALQNESAQKEIRRQFIKGLERDLNSPRAEVAGGGCSSFTPAEAPFHPIYWATTPSRPASHHSQPMTCSAASAAGGCCGSGSTSWRRRTRRSSICDR